MRSGPPRLLLAQNLFLHAQRCTSQDLDDAPHSSRSPSRPCPAGAPHVSSRVKHFTPIISLVDRVPYPTGLALIEQTANSSSLATDDSTRDLWAEKKS
jgi:hypothetical protein